MCSTNKSNNEIGSKDDDEDQGMDDSGNVIHLQNPGNQDDNGSSLRKAIGILFVCFVWVFTLAFAVVIIAA